jgi:hypothetical protein
VAIRLVAWRIAEGKREAAAAAKAGGGGGKAAGKGKGQVLGEAVVERQWRWAKLNGRSLHFSASWNVPLAGRFEVTRAVLE